ncbi:MAG: hypothetical protein AAFX75_07380 [Pseudomonadota bacterium]
MKTTTWSRGELLGLSLLLFAAAWVRFRGLGTWSLTTDEFFLYRSTVNFLETGLPAFPCGGYYVRGLLIQALMMPLLAIGVDVEYASRLVPALCSVLAIAGAYVLTRESTHRTAAIGVAIILSVSIWHIEMARFARMYAPFQALFVWHQVFLLRAISRPSAATYRPLVISSILAPLVWEGGIFLLLSNLLLPVFRKSLRPAGLNAFFILAIVGTVAFLKTDFRLGAQFTTDTFPPATGGSTIGDVLLPKLLWLSHSVPAILASVGTLVVAACLLARAARSGAVRGHALIALIAVGAALTANQLTLALLLAAGFGVSGWLAPNHFVNRWLPATATWMLLAGGFIWALFALVVPDGFSELKRVLIALIDYPNALDSLVRPWFAVFGPFALLLFFGVALAIARVLLTKRQEDDVDHVSVLLATIVLSITVLGLLSTTFTETRYAFFLYPLLLIAFVHGFGAVLGSVALRRSVRRIVATGALVVVFLFGPDFQPARIIGIADYDTNFRVGLPTRLVSHYYKRFDFDGAARYIEARAGTGSVTVTTLTEATPYLSADYVYLDESDNRFRGQACRNATIERWSNLPLIASADDLDELRRDSDVWVLLGERARVHNRWEQALIDQVGEASGWVTPDGNLRVIRLPRTSDGG